MFFKFHDTLQYDIFGTEYPLTDITKSSITFDKSKIVLKTINVDSRTPEQVAEDEYGDPFLYWTILIINNIVDPFLDWYMMEDHLYEYCIRIYGNEENMLKVRYFKDRYTEEIITGDDATVFQAMHDRGEALPENIDFVRNYDYEQLKNNQRKVIKVIPKQLITKFVEDFKSSLKGK